MQRTNYPSGGWLCFETGIGKVPLGSDMKSQGCVPCHISNQGRSRLSLEEGVGGKEVLLSREGDPLQT